ncbi:hypothetical protein C7446_2300 [Kushneria sinocarnis]|uniref:Uncharacterized protein n=1 Tax=Kushneria sinocarnis TaxID=595502 RepID=A0A420WVM1_9GAMM|nr:hypothetical protein [Kushneria sinocarnis]RKR02582.1 hypothetical protein C7446_2300 [Kushneria sinocarnis]
MANQRLNAVINIGGSVSRAFNSSIGTTQQRIAGIGDSIRDVEQQRRRIDRFDIKGLRETRDQLKEARRNVSRLSDELSESRRSTRQASDAYDAAKDRVEQLADEMRRADEPSEVLRHDFEQAREEAKRLGKELQDSEKQTRKLAREQKAAERSVDALQGQFEQERDELRRTRDQLQEAGVDTRNLADESEQLARKMERLQRRQQGWQRVQDRSGRVGSSFSRMNQEVGALGRNMAVLGGAATAAVGTVVHSFAEGTEETDQWARRLGMATSSLSQWVYAGQQFGVQQDAMIDGFKELSMRTDEFVKTGKGPASEAFQRLGLSADELGRVSDDTDALMGKVLGRIREIDNVASRQRIVDEVFGGQGGEQLAEMASLSAEQLGNLRREADRLGVSLTRKDGPAAREYMTAWRGFKGAMLGVRNTFGRSLMPLMTQGLNKLTSFIKDNRDQIKGWANDFGQHLKDALPTVIDIGRGFWRAGQAVGAVINKTADLVGGFDNLATIVGTLFAAKAIGSIFSFVGAVFSLGRAMVSLASATPLVAGGIRAIGAALMANPIGAIIGGIALAAGLIYANWDSLGPWLSDLWDGITAKVSAVWDWFKSTFSWHPLAMIANHWGGITDWFGDLWSGFKSAASTAWDGLKTVLAWSPIGLVARAWGGVSDWFAGLWSSITGQAQKAIDWIAGKLSWVGDAFSTAAGWIGLGDDESKSGEGKSRNSLESTADRPTFEAPDIQPRGSGSSTQAAAEAVRKVTNNITNNVSLSVSRREGERDEAYARRITDMVLEELNDRQQGALYDHG